MKKQTPSAEFCNWCIKATFVARSTALNSTLFFLSTFWVCSLVNVVLSKKNVHLHCNRNEYLPVVKKEMHKTRCAVLSRYSARSSYQLKDNRVKLIDPCYILQPWRGGCWLKKLFFTSQLLKLVTKTSFVQNLFWSSMVFNLKSFRVLG